MLQEGDCNRKTRPLSNLIKFVTANTKREKLIVNFIIVKTPKKDLDAFPFILIKLLARKILLIADFFHSSLLQPNESATKPPKKLKFSFL